MIKTSSVRAATVIAIALWVSASVALAQDRILVDPSGMSTGGLAYGIQFGPAVQDTVPPLAINCRVGAGVSAATPIDPTARVGPLTLIGISSNHSPCAGSNPYGLDFYTEGSAKLSISRDGLVGIGTVAPSRALDVRGAGDVEVSIFSTDPNGKYWTLQSTGTPKPNDPPAGTFQIIDRSVGVKRLWISPVGVVNVGTLQINGGSDVAEPFKGVAGLPKGSVVVIDEKSPGQLKLSDRPYDHRVAGIVSGANGIETGLSLTQSDGVDEQNIALTGRVYALADATRSSIHTGDLLTTSAMPGKVMKADPRKRYQGAIVGKAMTDLDRGTGYVLVLVTLQ